jgi:hypothetical protein
MLASDSVELASSEDSVKTVVPQRSLFRGDPNDAFNNELPECYTILGSQGSGKSYALKSLLFMARHFFTSGLVITGAKYNDDFRDIIEDCDIWDGWDEETFTLWLKVREEYQAKQHQLLAENRLTADGKKPQLLRPSFIVFDDLKGVLTSQKIPAIFDKFLAQYRHLNCWVFFAVQTITRGLPQPVADATHYALMYDTGSSTGQERLYSTFGSRLVGAQGHKAGWSKKEFLKHYSEATGKKNHCLLLKAPRGQDSCFRTFKADGFPPGFSMPWWEKKKMRMQQPAQH